MKRFLLLILISALLCGCSNSTNVTTISADRLAEETPSKIVIGIDDKSNGGSFDNGSIEGNSGSETQINSDPVTVNADVTVPLQSSYGIFGISTVGTTESEAFKIKDILLKNNDNEYGAAEYRVIQSRYGENYTWTSKGINLGISGYSSGISLGSEFSDFILNVFYPPTVNSATNINSFEQCNLGFCSREEAAKSVLKVLEQIGVTVHDNYEIYSLNRRDLQNAADAVLEKYPSIKDDGMFPTTIGSKYECYYIRFNAQYNGIPIYNQIINFKTIPDYFINNPEIEAIYSAEGLKYLRIADYPHQISLEKNVTDLISAEDAARIAVDKYKDVQTSSSISIDKLDLMYVYTPTVKNGKTSGEYSAMMTPSWICSGTLKYEAVNGTDRDEVELKIDIIVDAVTGKEII